MEILAIKRPPTTGPISNDDNIKVCPKCQAVLKFDYRDMWVKHRMGEELNFITCISCGKNIPVSKLERHSGH